MKTKRTRSNITVPQGSGMDGLLETIKDVMQTVRVDKLVINSNGELTVDWHTVGDEVAEDMTVDESVKLPSIVLSSPSDILARCELEEIASKKTAERTLLTMFSRLQGNGQHPVAFVAGDPSEGKLAKWLAPFSAPTQEEGVYAHLLGVPILFEPKFPSDVLILCGAPMPNAELRDTVFAVKISME